ASLIKSFSGPGKYTLPAKSGASGYYAELSEGFGSGEVSFDCVWALGYASLRNVLSGAEIESIRKITAGCDVLYSAGENADIKIPCEKDAEITLSLKKSDFNLSGETDFKYSAFEKERKRETFNISFEKQGFQTGSHGDFAVKNVNPVFWVEISNDFDVRTDTVSVTASTEGSGLRLLRETVSVVKKDGGGETEKTFVTFKCEGTYDSETDADVSFSVSVDLKINDDIPIAQKEPFAVWMETDNASYKTASDDKFLLGENDKSDGALAKKTLTYSYSFPDSLVNRNMAYDINGKLFSFNEGETRTVNLPLGGKAVFRLAVYNCSKSTAFAPEIIARLPFAGNMDFYSLDGDDDLGSEFDAVWDSLGEIFITRADGSVETVGKEHYSVLYSGFKNADFDSGLYTETEDGKTRAFKIIFDETVQLGHKDELAAKYTVNLPQSKELSGLTAYAAFASRYKLSAGGDKFNMSKNPGKAGITLGEPWERGRLIVTVKNTDGNTQLDYLHGIFLTLTGKSDWENLYGWREYSETVITDGDGMGIFIDVPFGEYTLLESAGVEHPYSEAAPVMITVDDEIKEIILTLNNTLQTGSLEILKSFEGTANVFPSKFRLYGTADHGTEVDVTVESDSGSFKFHDIPQGLYAIEEQYPDNFTGPEYTYGYSLYSDSAAVNAGENRIIEIEAQKAVGSLKTVLQKADGYAGAEQAARTFLLSGTSSLGEDILKIYKTEDPGGNKSASSALFENIPVGKYVIEEIFTHEDYALPVPRTVIISDKNYAGAVEAVFKSELKYGGIEIGAFPEAPAVKEGMLFKISGVSRYGNELCAYAVTDWKGRVSAITGIEEPGSGGYAVELMGVIPKKYSPDLLFGSYMSAGEFENKIKKALESSPEAPYITAENIAVPELRFESVIINGNETVSFAGYADGIMLKDKTVTTVTAAVKKGEAASEYEGALRITGIGSGAALCIYNIQCVKTVGDYENLYTVEGGIDVMAGQDGEILVENLPEGAYAVSRYFDALPNEAFILDGETRQIYEIKGETEVLAVFTDKKESPKALPKENSGEVLTVEAAIVGESGSLASEDDFINAGLDTAGGYQFEFLIKNIDTGDEYGAVLKDGAQLIIDNLPAGAYTLKQADILPFEITAMKTPYGKDAGIKDLGGGVFEFALAPASHGNANGQNGLTLKIVYKINPPENISGESSQNLFRLK
ncbi:MAG: hypothetical protein FWF08_08165, partial [Oscillospiraceae bacterium]|nr:hypothetical protein [Oscillospiraceae bacterium]